MERVCRGRDRRLTALVRSYDKAQAAETHFEIAQPPRFLTDLSAGRSGYNSRSSLCSRAGRARHLIGTWKVEPVGPVTGSKALRTRRDHRPRIAGRHEVRQVHSAFAAGEIPGAH